MMRESTAQHVQVFLRMKASDPTLPSSWILCVFLYAENSTMSWRGDPGRTTAVTLEFDYAARKTNGRTSTHRILAEVFPAYPELDRWILPEACKARLVDYTALISIV
ncbi:hypothetical protein PTI98_003612 [Pleurotus ostreatus]|nr:hypothetical protein PTI98_003612 [Pleurotus ostreatus]